MTVNNIDDLKKLIEDNDIQNVDVRFVDVPGVQQHFTVPVHAFLDGALTDGLAFDGSSIRGFQSIDKSDMKLIPDITTTFIDPFRPVPTIVVNFSVVDPFTDEPYSRDPRQVAAKAENYLRSTGIADTAFFAPEAEFYIFDDVRYETTVNGSMYKVDSCEGAWNSGREEYPNLGNKIRVKGGYFPVPPTDQYQDLRDEICENMASVGFKLERAHHEVGTGGQQEINYEFNTMVHSGDDLMKFKYIVKNTALENGKTVTFMPKPLFGDNGSGMHCHQSLWKDGQPLFFDENGYGGLSDTARWYIGGLIKHSGAVLAFTNPTANSYHRLVPGFEAPVNLVYSARNRSAAIRIPITGTSPKAKRIEFRVPDPSSNPYLAFAAQLMAGLDGIQNRIEPPAPIDKDLYELPPEEHAGIKQVPASLEEALIELEKDREFLEKGNVFSHDLIDAWIQYKRDEEIDALRLRPHPYEFEMYYGC
jgi:glutamine synthetase